ncbi:MAG TPA: protein-disulfide reductase DsbD family protein [Bacteroidales bacterium]|nr:protein-disulfide reductase DsbD family protein [Bacteroidales bacterium]
MNKRIAAIIAIMFIGWLMPLKAQILEPVKWRFSTEKVGEKEYDLLFIADIEPKWHLYAQDIPMSPPATVFSFEPSDAFTLLGKVMEPKATEQYDPNFEMKLKWYDKQVTFRQRVRLNSEGTAIVKGSIEFMACDDTRCSPPTEQDFQFTLQGSNASTTPVSPLSDVTNGPLNPVKWTYSAETLPTGELELVFDASIEDGFHLYSINIPENGPLPTEFTFDGASRFELVGSIVEGIKPRIKYDEVFEMEIGTFEGKAQFRQRIKPTNGMPLIIKGEIAYMVCDDKGCVALYEDFDLVYDGDQLIKAGEEQAQTLNEAGRADILGANSNLWVFFFVAFLAGLAAILTPCVFPMIPMTVSFFMKDKEHKLQGKMQALVYGFSIIAIYTLIGSILAVVAGPDIANWLSTHWLPNILFFLIFIIFAASFFGMFELTLPHWLINKADSQADRGGYLGSVFMAVTLVLVSFSCTGPIVGAILVESAGGQVLKPIIGMFGFSLAFALPFTLFAFFPSWLSNLPKSGGWLNSVKVVLGFIELALGLKFLSVADQTYHWGILDREVYIALWIVIFFLMGMYLLGKLRFAHDDELPYVGVPRLFLAIITFSFVVYLVPGMFGAPLKALSGYMPPMATHDFDLNRIIRENARAAGGTAQWKSQLEQCEPPKYADKLHLPHGLEGYFDYEQGVACAKALNKPVFIDFTGHGCVNCREMEANVWSDPRVIQLLQDEFVIIALYVDDKTSLPESEWVTSTYDGKVKKTIGRKWADFQISKFNVNAQPFYVIMGHNGEVLVQPRAYDLNRDAFVKFLQDGLKSFREGQSVFRIPG